ncbi:phage antirepressor KilAC domain-containing protein [Treponema phagedenis]|uniref:phage antirepressor KilAC domain-containing protein n=2 Tax=Treponema phagedenis TaxID=162 RepID=UPI0011EFFCD9|nr:phage antirepressor KilAC domain-containing protein [Treponema phagedenis]TYT78072.1 hypothetical protein FS559_02485 [Treponema phagedenis]
MSEITKNKTTTTSVPPNLTFQSKVENAGTEFEQNEILKIDTVENRQYVNARELHTQLQVGKIFAAWIKERIEKYSLIEGKDYKTCFPNQESEIHGGKNKQDYLLTVQAAKELAMIENNEQGRRIRQYLIKVEGREMKEAIKNETTMTVKEIAEALGTAESTIRNKAAELFPDVVKNGITTRLNEYQAQTIKNALVPRNLTLKSKVENTVTELEKNQTIIRAMQYLQERDAALRQENERLKLENAEMKPKVELADALTSSKGAISMAEAVKVLHLPFGRNTAFKMLRNAKVLNADNIPYQEYINRGYFRVRESSWRNAKGKTKISLVTEVFQKGMDYLRSFFINKEVLSA